MVLYSYYTGIICSLFNCMTVCTMIDGTRMTWMGRMGTEGDGGRWNADDAGGAD